MNEQQIDQEIVNLHNKGIGRTRIARSLSVTEWKVRTVVRGAITKAVTKKEGEQKTGFDIRLKKVTVSDPAPIKAIVLSDIHIPYHDQSALAVAVEYMKDYAPERIILNGDIVDFYQASSYRKDPIRLHTLQDEIDETHAFLQLVRNNHPQAQIDYVKGNHEDRIERFLLDKAPTLSSLRSLALDELFGLNELDIKFVDSKSRVMLGELEVTHGVITRRWSCYAAKAHHEKYGGSVLVGHTHKMGQFYHTNRWGTHIAIENGFLGRKDFEYTERPDWQHGFTTVQYFRDGQFSARQHFIRDGVLDVDSKRYEA